MKSRFGVCRKVLGGGSTGLTSTDSIAGVTMVASGARLRAHQLSQGSFVYVARGTYKTIIASRNSSGYFTHTGTTRSARLLLEPEYIASRSATLDSAPFLLTDLQKTCT